MMETILATGFTIVAATAAYILGERNASDGCNGHHWQDSGPQMDGLSWMLPLSIDNRDELVRAKARPYGLVVQLPRTKTCVDCGKTKKQFTDELTIDYKEIRDRM